MELCDLDKLKIILDTKTELELLKLSVKARESLFNLDKSIYKSGIKNQYYKIATYNGTINAGKLSGLKVDLRSFLEGRLKKHCSASVEKTINYNIALMAGKKYSCDKIDSRVLEILESKISLGSRKNKSMLNLEKDVKEAILELENFVNENKISNLDSLVKAGIIYAKFHILNPYGTDTDNIGNILLSLYVGKTGMGDNGFFISEEFENNFYDYYSRLDQVKNNNDWEPWIRFFLNCIIKQCQRSKKKVKEMVKLHKEMIKFAEENKISKGYIDYIIANPVFTNRLISEDIGISMSTASKINFFMAEHNKITIGGCPNSKVFYLNEVLKIME